jgi:hypothetical protein
MRLHRSERKIFQASFVFVLILFGLIGTIFLVDLPTDGKENQARAADRLSVTQGDFETEIISEYDRQSALERLNTVDKDTYDQLSGAELTSEDIKQLIDVLDDMEDRGEITREERIALGQELAARI